MKPKKASTVTNCACTGNTDTENKVASFDLVQFGTPQPLHENTGEVLYWLKLLELLTNDEAY